MKWLTLILSLLLPIVAHAEMPTLTGGLISSVVPGQARYKAGDVAHLSVVLNNTTGNAFTGTVYGTMYSRGYPVGAPLAIPVSSLANGGTQTLDMAFSPATQADQRGYYVYIQAKTASNTVVDTAGGSVSVESTPYIYPRYCFASQFWPSIKAATNVSSLNAWKCNGLQMYDVAHRQATPYTQGTTWTNLANLVVSAATLEAWIGNATQLGMFTNLFVDVGTADSTFWQSGEAVPLSWALFTASTNPTTANTVNYPAAGGTSCFGAGATGYFPGNWQSPFIVLLDPTNSQWQQYLSAGITKFNQAFGLTGFNLDTLGDPSCPNAYTYAGTAVNYATALGSVYGAVRSQTNMPGVIQDELGLHMINVLAQAPTFYLSELHPNFAAPNTYAQVATQANTVRANYGLSPPVFMVYSDETYAQNTPTCSTDGGSQTCYFNTPGVIYKDDAIMASGAWPMDVVDGSDGGVHIVSNIYVPSTAGQLGMHPDLMQEEYDIRNVGVAYEALLRQGTNFDTTHAASCTSGATCNTTGVAGQVYLIPEARPGFQILQMLNYSSLTSVSDASDTNANQPAPTQKNSIAVKMYYGGAVTGVNQLYMVSPDINHGMTQSISYTKGSDGAGNFITFTVPSLLYWDMIWLELDSLTTSSYATP